MKEKRKDNSKPRVKLARWDKRQRKRKKGKRKETKKHNSNPRVHQVRQDTRKRKWGERNGGVVEAKTVGVEDERKDQGS